MRSSPRGFWPALETVPGLSAVDAEWRTRFGDEYDAARSFLRPNGKRATSHPCTARPGCGCAHDVVEHGPNDIVAVRRCGRSCGTFPLTAADLVLYELDRAALGGAIAAAFDLVGQPDSVTGLHQTERIGVYSPTAGRRFFVYLTIQIEPDDFDHVVSSLVSRTDKPFVLLAPTRDLCTAPTERVLAHRKSAFIPLAEELALAGGRRRVRLRRPLDDILTAFRAAHLPAPNDDGSMLIFPTPPDATWGDVAIRFVDGHTVSIQVKSKRGVFNYTQMGMANRKNGDRTKQWKLLEGFSNSRGQIDWQSGHAALNVKKQKQELSKRLRAFFGLDDDPIEWVKDTRSYYRCKFTILPIGGDEYY